jgi:flagellar L-ring protein precursor FlgH
MRQLGPPLLSLLLLGCADVTGIPGVTTPPEQPLPKPPLPAEEVYEPAEGSLWRGDASRRFLAFEARAKRVGDLVTVQIVEQAQAENEASTETERTSNYEATLNSAAALQTIVTRPILNLLGLLGFTDQRSDKSPTAELNIVDAETKSDFEGEGTVKREATFTTTIACIVTGVTETGLLEIEGERQLRINGETQIIELSGFVRPEDIRIDNTIPSTLVASADIHYGGVGSVSGRQRVPWLMQIFDLVLPF